MTPFWQFVLGLVFAAAAVFSVFAGILLIGVEWPGPLFVPIPFIMAIVFGWMSFNDFKVFANPKK